jgi:hypothetical protein
LDITALSSTGISYAACIDASLKPKVCIHIYIYLRQMVYSCTSPFAFVEPRFLVVCGLLARDLPSLGGITKRVGRRHSHERCVQHLRR